LSGNGAVSAACPDGFEYHAPIQTAAQEGTGQKGQIEAQNLLPGSEEMERVIVAGTIQYK